MVALVAALPSYSSELIAEAMSSNVGGFRDFILMQLKIDPEDRPTAGELLLTDFIANFQDQ